LQRTLLAGRQEPNVAATARAGMPIALRKRSAGHRRSTTSRPNWTCGAKLQRIAMAIMPADTVTRSAGSRGIYQGRTRARPLGRHPSGPQKPRAIDAMRIGLRKWLFNRPTSDATLGWIGGLMCSSPWPSTSSAIRLVGDGGHMEFGGAGRAMPATSSFAACACMGDGLRVDNDASPLRERDTSREAHQRLLRAEVGAVAAIVLLANQRGCCDNRSDAGRTNNDPSTPRTILSIT